MKGVQKLSALRLQVCTLKIIPTICSTLWSQVCISRVWVDSALHFFMFYRGWLFRLPALSLLLEIKALIYQKMKE